jgi:hypothetical protein
MFRRMNSWGPSPTNQPGPNAGYAGFRGPHVDQDREVAIVSLISAIYPSECLSIRSFAQILR